MKDEKDLEDRKSLRRENFSKKKVQDKKQYDDDFYASKQKSKEFSKRKQELEEEDWEDWQRFYNR